MAFPGSEAFMRLQNLCPLHAGLRLDLSSFHERVRRSKVRPMKKEGASFARNQSVKFEYLNSGFFKAKAQKSIRTYHSMPSRIIVSLIIIFV
jgi:hypothetical protein